IALFGSRRGRPEWVLPESDHGNHLTVIRTETGDARWTEADADQGIDFGDFGHVGNGHGKRLRSAMEKTKRSIGGHDARLLDFDSSAACPMSASRPALILRNIVPVGPFRPLARLLGQPEPFPKAAGHSVEPVLGIGLRRRFGSLGGS